jgi:putative tryptophan/tyrosine transport system substrate-binding protein
MSGSGGNVYMRRREFITVLGGAAATWPLASRGQARSGRPLIVFFGSAYLANASGFIGALRDGLNELGYIEGRNIELVTRFAENQMERLPALAEEVVSLKPAVIVAGASDTALAAKRATSTIPIVTGALADAEHLGLVASYAHPGGNVTGIMPYVDGLPSKQIELAREVVPGLSKVGLLGNKNDAKVVHQLDELQDVARTLGLTAVVPEINNPEDVNVAINTLAKDRVDVVIVLQSAMLLSLRKQMAASMAANRLPAVYGYRQHVDAGGLISYGVDLLWCYHRAAYYVDKILNGAAPRDLPVEFPTKLQMVINLGTSKALGLTVPPTLLARADEVIE